MIPDMLKIKTEKGYLDYSSDFSIQVEETSPVMNDRGSQTLPATVPATPGNALATCFPHRIDNSSEPMGGKQNCVVSDGVYNRRGLINLVSASRRDGITFNIGFDNAEAYARWKNKKLSELDNLPVFAPGSIEALGSHLDRVHAGSTDADYAVFRVVVEEDGKDADGNAEYVMALNRGPFPVSGRTEMRDIDGKPTEVNLPPGYGATAFLYVWRVIELIFADIGVAVGENPFAGDAELRRLVVLNNCADACCLGELRYIDLMPTCTVEAFLNALKVRFGLVYNVDFNKSVVTLRLIRDILNDTVQDDISGVLSDVLSVSFDTPRYVALSAATSIEGAAPVTERFEDFIKDADVSTVSSVPELSSALHTPLVYTFMSGEWFKWDRFNEEYESSGSSFFKWDPQTNGCEAEDMSSEDEFVPLRKFATGYEPCYLVGASHRHSYIKGYKQETPDTPLAFLFAFRNVVNRGGITATTYGSWSPALPNGENAAFADGSTHTFTLLFQFSNGLFANFWKGYDEILRHGFRTVEVAGLMRLHRISAIDLLKPVSLHGQRLLFDTISYSLPTSAEVPVELRLRTLRPVGEYDIEEEQNIPDFGPGVRNLQWTFASDDMWHSAMSLLDLVLSTYNQEHQDAAPCDVASLVTGYPNTKGCVTWQTDEELAAMTPSADGEILHRQYFCVAKYNIGRHTVAGVPSSPVKWESTVARDVAYTVTLKGRIL